MSLKKMDKYEENYYLIKRKLIKNELLILSPTIKERIIEEITLEAKEPDKKSEYLNDYVQTIIFMEKYKTKSPYPIIFQMATESLFATYQHQKENGYKYNTFDDFFNEKEEHPFERIKGYSINDNRLYEDDDGKTLKEGTYVLIRNEVAKGYSLFFNKTLTHEIQHQCSGEGTNTNKKSISDALNLLNEMCTEYNAIQIIKNQMDSNVTKEKYSFTIIKDKNNRKIEKINYISEYAHYKEQEAFFPAILHIVPGINEIYYDKNKDLDSLPDNQKKYIPDILKFTESAALLYDDPKGSLTPVEWFKKRIVPFIEKFSIFESQNTASFSNRICFDQNFDAMVDSFSSLAEKYVRNLGLNKSTTPDSIEGAITFKKVEEFFNTFDSITFQKDGENFTQKELIKEKILGAIYYNDKSSEEAINRLNNERTFVEEFKENCNTATETIEKSKTSESEITTSIKKTKENETTKDNSKSDDLEI